MKDEFYPDIEKSELFKAEYSINEGILPDIYVDLKAKLSSLYGETIEPKRTAGWKEYYDITVKNEAYWEAADGSSLWLALYYNTSKNEYRSIKIAYAAPNSTARLIELEQQIDYEANLDLDKIEATPSNDDMSGL